MPVFSVIIPCFNHASFVGEAIEAVLAQTFGDFELFVVDDFSHDNSREVIEKYVKSDSRVRAIYHTFNQGISPTRDDAIRVAQGEYLAFCDADDVWMPTKLARQLELLEQHPEHDVAYCDAAIINEHGMDTGERFTREFPVPGDGSGMLFDELCTRNFVNIQTAIVRRECIGDAGYFNDGEGIKLVDDWWFWLRVSYRHSFIYTDEVLARYRVHQRSTGRVQRTAYDVNRIKVFHRVLDYYPTISSKVKSEMYYHIGMALKRLGKEKYASRCFAKSMAINGSNWRAVCRLLLALCSIPSCRLHNRPAIPMRRAVCFHPMDEA
jgi:glycosyltransferase involved in cell wall biosynthesis